MKKFVFYILLFFGLVALCDITLGLCLDFLLARAKGGENGHNNYIAHHMKDDIVLIGSSRCMHHYDPRILEDSLNMTVYNTGREANGILLHYAYYKIYSSRYAPTMIVCDIMPKYDIQVSKDNNSYLNWSRLFYGIAGTDSLFWAIDPTERYKMLSRCYQYNNKHLQVISDCIHPLQQFVKGYQPIDGEMKDETKELADQETTYEVDSLKLHYLERLVLDCQRNSTQLVFVSSPCYNKAIHTIKFQPVRDLAARYDIPFLEHHNDTTFCNNKRFFSDGIHLNRTGATEFSKYIVAELRSILNAGEKP